MSNVALTDNEAIILTAFALKQETWQHENDFNDLGYKPSTLNDVFRSLESKKLITSKDQPRIYLCRKTRKPKKYKVRMYSLEEHAMDVLDEHEEKNAIIEPESITVEVPKPSFDNDCIITLEDSLSFLTFTEEDY